MAAESVGMSQKKKDRAATIGMIIFFSILAILTVLPIYLLVLASFKPGNFLLQYGLNLNLDIPHLDMVWQQPYLNRDHCDPDVGDQCICCIWICSI